MDQKLSQRKIHAESLSLKNFQKGLFTGLCFQDMWVTLGHYYESSGCFEYPKKSLLKTSHKKYLPNFFLPQNIPEWKITKPKKSFDHRNYLKSRVPPPSAGVVG